MKARQQVGYSESTTDQDIIVSLIKMFQIEVSDSWRYFDFLPPPHFFGGDFRLGA